jgi:hypothetical protein
LEDFTIASRFTDYASSEILQHQECVPAKSVTPCVTNHPLASKMITAVDTEILLFRWSVTQFFMSASTSGHFATSAQKGVYSSLTTALLPLTFSIYVPFSWFNPLKMKRICFI